MAAISTQELKLLIENSITENIKTNHIFFKKIFDVFFEYLSDTYKLGTDSHLILETDKNLWDSDYSQLNHVDLTDIKKELIKTYLHDYNIFFDKLQNDESILRYINNLYTGLGIDRSFDTSKLYDMINEEEFLIHKKFAQQKTVPLLFNYIQDLIAKTGVGQFDSDEAYFNMYEGTNYNPRKAFAYTVDTSLFKPIYDSSIKPITHPLGFSYNYYKELNSSFTEYFNLETEIVDFKVYELDGTVELNVYNDEGTMIGSACSESLDATMDVPQFSVPVVNTLSNYGSAKTNIAGITFQRTSSKEYKLVSDGLENFEGIINNCKLLDWNLDSQSYVTHEDENTDEDIRRDLYGGILNYNDKDLTLLDLSNFELYDELGDTIGEIIAGGEIVYDAFYDIPRKQVWIRKWDENLNGEGDGDYYWVRSSYLGMNRDFITFASTESMYSLEALQFSNPDDNVRIWSPDADKVLNPYGGCYTFFITLLDDENDHYIWTADKEQGTTITHSMKINTKGLYINEMNGTNSTALFDFQLNRRYHVTFNWDNNGRRVFVDGIELFLEDDNKAYNEKFFIKGVDISGFSLNEIIEIEVPLLKRSLTYDEIYSQIETKKIELNVNYLKGDTILFENYSQPFIEIEQEIQDIIDSINGDIAAVQNQLLRVITLSKDSAYVTIETQRVNKLIESARDYISVIRNFSINFKSLTIPYLEVYVEDDERKIKDMFDLIDDDEVAFQYSIPLSTASFEFFTEVNEIILGNPYYYQEQSVVRANYILDNFDILNRPMTLIEINDMRADHDTYVKSEEFYDSGLLMYFSLDRKIFETYHNEAEAVDHCFSPWYIGETYDIGLDANLLFQYYNDMENCGLIFDAEAYAFGDYLEHPKAMVDESLEFNNNTVIYENVIGVSETEEDGKPKLIIILDNGKDVDTTRIEYIKNKYWKLYNNSTGELIESRYENIIMDYSYQIKVTGTKLTDGEMNHILYSQLGEDKASYNDEKILKENLSYDRKYRNVYLLNEPQSYTDTTTITIDGEDITLYTLTESYFDSLVTFYEKTNWYNDIWTRVEGFKRFDMVMNFGEESFYENEILLGSDVDFISDAEFIESSISDGHKFMTIRNGEEVKCVNIDTTPVYESFNELGENLYNSIAEESITLSQTFEQAVYDKDNNLVETKTVVINY